MVRSVTEVKYFISTSTHLGVNFFVRKMANNFSTTLQLIKEGEDSYSFETKSAFKSRSIKFKLNEEFDENTMDGRIIKCLITFEGNKMIQQQRGEGAFRVERIF